MTGSLSLQIGQEDMVKIGLPDINVYPNFLIVGAAKAGTTSLYFWLNQHPDVFLPSLKEPSYFAPQYQLRIANWDRYLALFQPGKGKKAIGEASVIYMDDPETPRLIHDALGKIKILIVLRNPVERAFSYYCWNLMFGYETVRAFEAALECEDQRLADEGFRKNNPSRYIWAYAYFHTGLYYEQVKRYLETFGDQVSIHLFEDLVARPEATFIDVCHFLGISAEYKLAFEPKNQSRIPRSIPLQYNIRKMILASQKIRPWRLGIGFRLVLSAIHDLNIRAGFPKPSILPETKSNLQEKYRDNINKLSTLIQRDLAYWYDGAVSGEMVQK